MKHRACLMPTFLLMLTLLESASAEVIESYAVPGQQDQRAAQRLRAERPHPPGREIRPRRGRIAQADASRRRARAGGAVQGRRGRRHRAARPAISGYRSYWTQNDLEKRRLKETSLARRLRLRRQARPERTPDRPGHGSGLHAAHTDLTERFAETPAYAWLSEHAHEYGFGTIQLSQGRHRRDGLRLRAVAHPLSGRPRRGRLRERADARGPGTHAGWAESRPLQSYEFPVTELALKGLG